MELGFSRLSFNEKAKKTISFVNFIFLHALNEDFTPGSSGATRRYADFVKISYSKSEKSEKLRK